MTLLGSDFQWVKTFLSCFSRESKILLASLNTKTNQQNRSVIMTRFKKGLLTALIVGTLCTNASAFDGVQNAPKPPNAIWQIAETSNYGQWKGKPYKNVHIYKNCRHSTTYVQLVDLEQGAQVKMLQYQGWVDSKGHKNYWINDIDYWWNQMGSTQTSKVSVINGQFFNDQLPWGSPLSFPIKSEGWIDKSTKDMTGIKYPLKQMNFSSFGPWISKYYDYGTFPNGKYNDSMEHSIAPNAIVGLDIREDRGKWIPKARTYVCALDFNRNGRNSTALLIYSSASNATYLYGKTTLSAFESSNFLIFDFSFALTMTFMSELFDFMAKSTDKFTESLSVSTATELTSMSKTT